MQEIVWNNIKIRLDYVENYSQAYERIYGERMSHIGIHCDEELPMTETGYKSIFILESNLKRWGGLEKYIIDSLNTASKSEEWKLKERNKKQLCLF